MSYKMMHQEELDRQHIKVQEQIKKLPQQAQDIIAKEKLILDSAFEQANDQYFDFSVDDFLKAHNLAGNNREEFLFEAKRAAGSGKTFTFDTTKGVREFYVAPDGKIMFATNYIYILEKSLISKSKNLIKEIFTNLSFFDILKLTFKKFIGGLNG